MTDAVTSEQLIGALNHALSRVHEFDELDDKLGAFGLPTPAVYGLLCERWLRYRDELEDTAANQALFVRGFVEGLLTGMQLASR